MFWVTESSYGRRDVGSEKTRTNKAYRGRFSQERVRNSAEEGRIKAAQA
jgi:hypothetical protein